jgi:hypothetical protein
MNQYIRGAPHRQCLTEPGHGAENPRRNPEEERALELKDIPHEPDLILRPVCN